MGGDSGFCHAHRGGWGTQYCDHAIGIKLRKTVVKQSLNNTTQKKPANK